MLSIASSYKKKIKIKKTFRHMEIMVFTSFFLNRFFRTRYEKKPIHADLRAKKSIHAEPGPSPD